MNAFTKLFERRAAVAQRAGFLTLIGVFKLVKALALFAIGGGALVLGPARVARSSEQLLGALGLFPGHAALLRGVERLWSLDPRTAARLGALLLVYGAIFAVEGVGLLCRRRWAEWLTVVVTGSFIPFEIYELVAHPSLGKVAALAVNVVVLIYLLWRRLTS